jgi:hypothetical protein
MSTTYIEQLQKLAAGNFLGGVVQKASADLMAERQGATTRVLTQLNQKIGSLESGSPTPTAMQIDKLTSDPTAKKHIASLEEEALSYQKLQQDILSQQQQFSTAYTEAIQALTTIGGDEAMQAIRLLEGRADLKMKQLDREGKLPLEKAQFQNALQQNAKGQLDFEITYKTWIKQEESRYLSDLILNSESFKRMPMGERAYNSERSYLSANAELQRGIEDVIAEIQSDPSFLTFFGENKPDAGALQAAVQNMLQLLDVKIKYKQPEQNTSNAGQLELIKQQMQMQEDFTNSRALLSSLSAQRNADAYGVHRFLTEHVPRLYTQLTKQLGTKEGMEAYNQLFDPKTGEVKIDLAEKYYTSFAQANGIEVSIDRYRGWIETFGAGGQYESILRKYRSLYPYFNEGKNLYHFDNNGKMVLDKRKTPLDMSQVMNRVDPKEDKLLYDRLNFIRKDVEGKLSGMPIDSDIIFPSVEPGSMLQNREHQWNPKWAREISGLLNPDADLSQEVQNYIDKYKLALPPGLQTPASSNSEEGTIFDQLRFDYRTKNPKAL